MTLTINIHNTEETRENGFVNRWPLQTNESITLQQFQVMLPLFAAKEMYLFALNTIYFTIRKKSRSTNALLTWVYTGVVSPPFVLSWQQNWQQRRETTGKKQWSGETECGRFELRIDGCCHYSHFFAVHWTHKIAEKYLWHAQHLKD